MATLSITVNDSIVPRVVAAYGVSTNAQLKAAIISDIKNKVIVYETEQVAVTENAKIQTAINNKDSAITSKQTTASSEIVLS